ncbi:MAG: methyltransferase, partial [Gammaproteobacteria bacterium]|nr:methyltransferase [Gammaproteobacteria bacterium]
MRRFSRRVSASLLAIGASLAGAASLASEGVDPALAAVIAADHRSPANKARDQYRHPAETLTFFGLKPDMRVVEVWPGGGWYTEILAPYLSRNGKYYAA